MLQARQSHSVPAGMRARTGLHALPGAWIARSQCAQPTSVPAREPHVLHSSWCASFQRVYVRGS